MSPRPMPSRFSPLLPLSPGAAASPAGASSALRPGRLALELAAGALALLVLLAAASMLDASARLAFLALACYLGMAALLWGALTCTPWPWAGMGAANGVTLTRGVLVALLAGSLADPSLLADRAEWLFGVALVALALDGADGWVARRTGSTSALGARFDMELDAFFILVLCLALLLLGRVGAWVLAIGAMRFAFVAASWRWPWLGAELPESLRRKAVCVWQVAALMLALLPATPEVLAGWLAATALTALALSFGTDVRWLWQREDSGKYFRK